MKIYPSVEQPPHEHPTFPPRRTLPRFRPGDSKGISGRNFGKANSRRAHDALDMNTPDSQTEKIRNLIEKFPTAMLITHDADRLHARPMAVADVDEDCTLWFITGDYTTAAWEVACQKQAHVVFQNDHSAYLSISGEASLVHDRVRVREVWKESFRTWFPDGKDDPGLVLISFRPDRAEYWDNTGFKRIAYLWEAARAYVSGDTPRVKEGEQHGVVQFP